MSLPAAVQVLVVGSGPTGLAAAITLAKLGLQVAIVDASITNPVGARASIIHPQTLEVLNTIDLAEPLLRTGNQSKGFRFYGTSDKLLEFDVSQLKNETRFPITVHIPQDDIERMFQQKLISEGIQIFRNKKVIGMGYDVVSPGLDVKFEDGTVVRAQYIVGADGSHSTIRRLAGIDFKDPQTGVHYDDANSPPIYIVHADVYLEEPLPVSIPRDQVSLHLDNLLLLLIPLTPQKATQTQSASFWRIGFGIPGGSNNAPRSLEYLQEQIDARNPWGVKVTISSVVASSRYRVRSAVASTYFRKVGDGNVLLAGDAAHVFSPAGAQGMNLGISDAIAVANAIYAHHKADTKDKDSVLEHYADSRRKTGIKVIHLASNLTALVTASFGWRRLLRNAVFCIMRHLPYVNRIGTWRISGLSSRLK